MSTTEGRTRISVYLRLLRKNRKLNQDVLADLLKVSRQTYSHYENARLIPSTVSLGILADFYGISSELLVNLAVLDAQDALKSEEDSMNFLSSITKNEKGKKLISETSATYCPDADAKQDFLMNMDNREVGEGELDEREFLFYYDELDSDDQKYIRSLVKRMYLMKKHENDKKS